MPTPATNPLRREILRLAHAGLDLNEFGRRAANALRRAIPFDGVAVVAFDPATALPIGEWVDNALVGAAGARLLDIELNEPDVNKFSELAASRRPAASMSGATGGNLELSRRHRELKRPHGFGDELRGMCVAGSGAWGAIVLHRELGAPNFTPREVELVASSSSEFAEAFRRMSLQRDLSTVTTQPRHREPGMLLLDDEDAIEMANATAAAWLDELRDDGLPIPLVVTAVARRARAIAAGHSDIAATARVRTAAGRWVIARGSTLRNGNHARTAVTLTPAQAPELAELISGAYGLTARERLVTELVAQGLPSVTIAARLHLSSYTVQDHLKAIFEKLDVSSRGQLVARLFLDHYQVNGRLSDPRRREPCGLPAAVSGETTADRRQPSRSR
jgi:DNA-binding NarL/FixJ family response regulator